VREAITARFHSPPLAPSECTLLFSLLLHLL
jgi:hypothetical protein